MDGQIWCLGGGLRQPDGLPMYADRLQRFDDREQGNVFPIDHTVAFVLGFLSCVADVGGRVRCWSSHAKIHPVAIKSSVALIVVRPSEVCGLDAAGLVTCTDGLSNEQGPVVERLRDVTQLAGAYGHACAVMRDGHVACWGTNEHGQLGDGSRIARPDPVTVQGLAPARQVAVGAVSSCALLLDGTVWCWGDNSEGQLGDGSPAGHFAPAPVPGLVAIRQVVTSAGGACARDAQRVLCWGSGDLLGGASSPTPLSMTTLPESIEELVAGDSHVCARKGDRLWCWGYVFVQLDDGRFSRLTTTFSTTPTLGPRLCP